MKVVHIDNKKYFVIPQKKKEWWNYHITKHIILAKREMLGRIMDVDNEIIKKIKSEQQKLSCKVDPNISRIQSCNKCTSIKQCNTLLKDISKNYEDKLYIILDNDEKQPTHAHSDARASRYTYSVEKQLTVIDQLGLIILAYVREDKLFLSTFYSPDLGYDVRNMDYNCFRILTNSPGTVLKEKSLKMWKTRLSGKNPIYHNKQNWNIS